MGEALNPDRRLKCVQIMFAPRQRALVRCSCASVLIRSPAVPIDGWSMRFFFIPLFWVLLTSSAASYGSMATGADWGADYDGHPGHLDWLARFVEANTIEAAMVELCLDHVTTGEDDYEVPKNVAQVPLNDLTRWCMRQVLPIGDARRFRGKTFRYPDGMVPLSE